MNERKTQRMPMVAALVLLTVVAQGCGNQMDTATTCREFLQAPRDEQNAALARVADEVGASNTLNPLGRPNIDFLCSQNQDRTLGEVVEMTG